MLEVHRPRNRDPAGKAQGCHPGLNQDGKGRPGESVSNSPPALPVWALCGLLTEVTLAASFRGQPDTHGEPSPPAGGRGGCIAHTVTPQDRGLVGVLFATSQGSPAGLSLRRAALTPQGPALR